MYKVVDRIENYNFHIDHINIQDCLIILNFKFQDLGFQISNFKLIHHLEDLSVHHSCLSKMLIM